MSAPFAQKRHLCAVAEAVLRTSTLCAPTMLGADTNRDITLAVEREHNGRRTGRAALRNCQGLADGVDVDHSGRAVARLRLVLPILL